MASSRFLTKYTLPVRSLREYDPEDNVDRLSYCDTATSIARFMRAGRDLRYSRSQAMYKSFNDIGDEVGTETPVFPEDPVDMSMKLKGMTDELNSKIRNSASDPKVKRSETPGSDVKNSDLEVPSVDSNSQKDSSESSN